MYTDTQSQLIFTELLHVRLIPTSRTVLRTQKGACTTVVRAGLVCHAHNSTHNSLAAPDTCWPVQHLLHKAVS